MRRVVLCGDCTDSVSVCAALDTIHEGQPIELLVHRGNGRMEEVAHSWARQHKVRETRPACASWAVDKRPSVVVAFPGKDTEQLVRRARRAGIAVIETGV